MGKIHVLDREISNKIAAGEVVERPVSVIKELVENSIDAGATVVTVEIQHGGNTYIRVTDNGSGMTAEDASIAFLRHATSKIQTAEDLDAIYTLGFRGEALSSIGAVAEVDLFTKRIEDGEGTHVVCRGGEILPAESAGAADGTTIVVKNLFYNTPARMKFLKKDATESGYISDIMTRFVLAHPEISFRLINTGKEVLHSPGDNNLKNAIYTMYGRDYAKAALDVHYENEGITVSGIVGTGNVCRPNRSYQSFFVNRRYIKSALIIRAAEDAYKNQMMVGKFPMAALNIEIDPSMIDINVHPTKLEVKFSDEKLVYETVYFGVKNALYAHMNIPKVEKSEPEQAENITPIFTDKSDSGQQAKIPVVSPPFAPPAAAAGKQMFSPKSAGQSQRYSQGYGTPSARTQSSYSQPSYPRRPETAPMRSKINSASGAVIREPELPPVSIYESKATRTNAEQPENMEETAGRRVIGQVFATYILVEHNDEMLIVDQHAAHERLKYEQLKRELESSSVISQMLLVPIVVTLAAPEYAAYREHAEKFEKFGFETEDFGDQSVLVRSVPQELEHDDISQALVEMLTQLIQSKNEIGTEQQDRVLYTIACRSAVKANHVLSVQEMQALVNNVLKMDNINTCPHGRPIMISMSKREMEKEFKRIV